MRKQFWKNIEKMQNYLCLSDFEVSSVIGISEKSYKKRRDQFGRLSFDEMYNLACEFSFDPVSFIKGEINFDQIHDYYYKTDKSLTPSQYSTYAHSKVKTLNCLLGYEEGKYRREICHKFNLGEEFLENADNRYNIKLLMDIGKFYSSKGVSLAAFAGMGARSVGSAKGDLKKIVSKKSLLDFYESFFHNITYFEKNYLYKIKKVSGNSLFFEARFMEEARDTMKVKYLSTRELDFFKVGVVKAAPEIAGFRPRNKVSFFEEENKTIFKIELDS